MADAKITDLGTISGANVADGDYLVLVDVSDTSMAASGTDKKIRTDEARIPFGGRPYISDTAPDGHLYPLWFDSTSGILYLWYSTAATPVWVEV